MTMSVVCSASWVHEVFEYSTPDLADDNDLNSSNGSSYHPRFQGWINQEEYSYMLKTDGVPSDCYPKTAVQSDAIDAGNPDSKYDDPLSHTPSLGTVLNDIGAYGGPEAAWDDADLPPPDNNNACLEYTAMP